MSEAYEVEARFIRRDDLAAVVAEKLGFSSSADLNGDGLCILRTGQTDFITSPTLPNQLVTRHQDYKDSINPPRHRSMLPELAQ